MGKDESIKKINISQNLISVVSWKLFTKMLHTLSFIFSLKSRTKMCETILQTFWCAAKIIYEWRQFCMCEKSDFLLRTKMFYLHIYTSEGEILTCSTFLRKLHEFLYNERIFVLFFRRFEWRPLRPISKTTRHFSCCTYNNQHENFWTLQTINQISGRTGS